MLKDVLGQVNLVSDSVNNISRLSGEILLKSKKSKVIPQVIRKLIIDMHTASVATLHHISDLKEKINANQ